MNNKTIFITLLVVVALLGALVGGYLVSKFKKCPQIKVGTETTLVNIVVHDTVRTVKTVKDFVVTKDTIYLDSGKTVKDTQNCYSFSEKEKDGAFIKADICSKEFPPVKPADLRGSIAYQGRPDTNRIITRVDTVSRTISTPFYKSWQTYVVALVAILAGAFIPHH